ncbi:MAG: hypothetical protein ACTSUO_00790 [Candidatus Thorarchaeota archaeon]
MSKPNLKEAIKGIIEEEFSSEIERIVREAVRELIGDSDFADYVKGKLAEIIQDVFDDDEIYDIIKDKVLSDVKKALGIEK